MFANSSAILTDAFPQDQRGLALGINSIAMVAGSFIGLVIGGVLAPLEWRLVFLVSVPVGLVRDGLVVPQPARDRRAQGGEDRLVGQRHLRRRPDRGDGRDHLRDPALRRSHDGLDRPVRARDARSAVSPCSRCSAWSRRTSTEPMFHLDLFRIRAFSAGNLAALLAAMGRGGLQFILIIWLQGIWLPEHGYAFSQTPLWAGIYMLPLIAGLLIAGPASGCLSDRFGARPFATGGMLIAAVELRAADRAAGRLLLRLVRADPASEWNRHGPLHLAEQRRGDEQPAAVAARGRSGDARNLLELRERALDRSLLLADDRRPLVRPPERRCTTGWSPMVSRPPTRARVATCHRSRPSLPRSSATTRSRTCSARTSSRRSAPQTHACSPAAASSRS